MESSAVDNYLQANRRYFAVSQLSDIRQRLSAADPAQWERIRALRYKNPTTALILTCLVGIFGIDRFYVEDPGLAAGKLGASLLTCGVGGLLWSIVDLFSIKSAARRKNYESISAAL